MSVAKPFPAHSFRAVVSVPSGSHPLLGGYLKVDSSRYEHEDQAQFWLEQCVEANRNRAEIEAKVEPDFRFPEIFTHCGEDVSSISSKCPGCGKILTYEDAKEKVLSVKSEEERWAEVNAEAAET